MFKETIVESGKPARQLESNDSLPSQQLGNPSSYVGTPAVGTSRAVSSAGFRRPVRPTRFRTSVDAGLHGYASLSHSLGLCSG
jgi:hypothetical protein